MKDTITIKQIEDAIDTIDVLSERHRAIVKKQLPYHGDVTTEQLKEIMSELPRWVFHHLTDLVNFNLNYEPR